MVLWAMFLAIVLFVSGSIILLTMVSAPTAEDKFKTWHSREEKVVEKQLDNLFYYDKNPKQIMRLYFILPPLFGAVGYIFTQSFIFVFVGAFLGLLIPNLILKIRNSRRRRKFNQQILDAIMILSSALKGGLSLLQSLEVLVEEMPAPMSQEIGLLVRENKMGVNLEECFRRLDKRMNLEELSLVINSILVARETGGDLTKVFSRLTMTIRDNRKLKDSIKTLTIQGRLQGLIMSLLPIVFVWWVVAHNPHHFDVMLQSEIGRTLLITAAVLQVVGMFLIRKFSSIKI